MFPAIIWGHLSVPFKKPYSVSEKSSIRFACFQVNIIQDPFRCLMEMLTIL